MAVSRWGDRVGAVSFVEEVGMPDETRRVRWLARSARRIALLAILTLASVASPGFWASLPANGQDSIDDARDEREQARQEKAAAAAELDAAKADDAEVAAALGAITELVDAQQLRVSEAQRQLALHQSELLLARAEVEAAEAAQVGLEIQLSQTAVSGFVTAGEGATGFLQVDDVTRALRQEALLDEVKADTEELLEQLLIVQEDRDIAEVRADNALTESTRIEAELAIILVDLEGQQAIQAELKAEMETRVRRWQAELAEAQAEEAKLTEFIRREEAKAAAPPPAPAPSAGNPSSHGFQWPLSAPITSGYGYRVHPIHGTRRLHKGIDLAAGSGSAIAASKGGTVISAGWLGGYGNAVVISHGNGLTTLYAHQSKIAVTVGQGVGRGEVIGYVGSTGQSTGPHLHFEIRSNGAPVNPRPYLP